MTSPATGSLSQRLTAILVSRSSLGLALLLAALLATAAGVAGQMDRLEAGLLVLSVAASLLLSWALATSSIRGRTAALVSLAVGAAGVLGRVGRLDRGVGALLKAVGRAWWNAVQALLGAGEPDALSGGVVGLIEPVLSSLGELASDVLGLLERVAVGLRNAAAGGHPFDPVSSTVAWSLALWAVAAWAAWMHRRRDKPLAGLAPAAVLLTGVLSLGEGSLGYVLTLLAAMLLLLASSSYDRRVRRWSRDQVGYPDVRVDLAFASVGLTLALVAASGAAATIDLEQIREAFEHPAGGAGNGDGSAPGEPEEPGTEPQGPIYRAGVSGLPRTHVLGPGPEFVGYAVMRIRVGAGESVAGYWRSVTYDRYTGVGWHASNTAVVDYAADEPLGVELPPSARSMRQEVEILVDLGEALFASGSLSSVDQEYSVLWRSNEDQFGASTEATTYVAESFVSAASDEELRSAGEDYPAWVAQRYLSLPQLLPDQVLALARDLTATEPTPYDRVRAIEDYLRDFEYSLDVGQPPRGRDVVDYFLFDLKKGFCDYYATAMAVLARAAGVPARLAIGYTRGMFDRTTGRFLVNDTNAHAWVEVYDEQLGEVVAERRRKHSRRGSDWLDYDEDDDL